VHETPLCAAQCNPIRARLADPARKRSHRPAISLLKTMRGDRRNFGRVPNIVFCRIERGSIPWAGARITATKRTDAHDSPASKSIRRCESGYLILLPSTP
jgi:hypothetical protein